MLELVVLGDPVEHSLSPVIHTAALEATGLVGRYTARRVDVGGMYEAVDEVRRGSLSGANVTKPHKALACRLADAVEPEARRAASVNTLVSSSARVEGYSTDIVAIRTVWNRVGFAEEAPVLLLGSGGAAAAALLALEGAPLSLAARHISRADALIERTGVDAQTVPWGRPLPGAVVVNATPLGMRGESLPPGIVADSAGLFDMTYGKLPTPAVTLARSVGLTAVDGITMLLEQAAASFELWTGVAAPRPAMLAAVQKAQGLA
jgi:shikimate dehydrogenase